MLKLAVQVAYQTTAWLLSLTRARILQKPKKCSSVFFIYFTKLIRKPKINIIKHRKNVIKSNFFNVLYNTEAYVKTEQKIQEGINTWFQ
jgi:hypothetical protein